MPFRRQRGWGLKKPPYGTPLERRHPLAKGLVASWLMNEAGAFKITDLASSGTYNFSLPATVHITWKPDVRGPVIDRTVGGSDRLTLSTSLASGTTFSIACRVLLRTTPAYTSILTFGSTSGFYISSGKMNYYFSGDHLGTNSLSTNAYHDLVVSVNNGALSFFQDGKSNGTASSFPSISWAGSFVDEAGVHWAGGD